MVEQTRRTFIRTAMAAAAAKAIGIRVWRVFVFGKSGLIRLPIALSRKKMMPITVRTWQRMPQTVNIEELMRDLVL
jgi:hypothetical protein